MVCLADDGSVVRPALLWNDVRSAGAAADLVADLGDGDVAAGAQAWADAVGLVPVASFTGPKLRWLADAEPANADRTAAVCLPHDWLTWQLAGAPGLAALTTDRGDASGTAYWSARTGEYRFDLLELALRGRRPHVPRVAGPAEVVGTVAGSDAVLGPGSGDNAAAALGLGLRPGMPVMSLGTSGTVYAVSQRRPADPSGTVAGFADARGDWLPLACTLNCTLAVDRVATLLGLDREAVEPGTAVTLLPFLDGERTPNLPNASGLLHGLRHDTTPGQLLQAAYDGAVHSLLGALDLVLDQDADPSAPLLLIGGGARGSAWQQTVLRLSGRPVQVPEAKELVALGAAAQAAGVLTGEDPAAVARRWDTAAGPVLDAVERDQETLARIAGVLSDAAPLLERPTDSH
jgi:xylulokinase